MIDGIQWDDFSINPVYARNSHSRGLFEWGMLYKEGTVPAKEEKRRDHHSEPYYAPTHAGGLFAINRDWFKELGWYDPGIHINLQIIHHLHYYSLIRTLGLGRRKL